MINSRPHAGHVVAFIDIGTNSIRLLVVRFSQNFSYIILSQEKEVVRLGEEEFIDNVLRPEAIERAVLVCRKFAELSRLYGADEIITVATSATREAQNQAEFLERLRAEAGIEVGVISGLEEARLVYLGVSSAVHLGLKEALFIDIGGGSTEIAVGNQTECQFLDTLKLGAIRLTNMFVPDAYEGPIEKETYARMKKHVKGLINHTIGSIKKHDIELAIGSSGTVINLGEIASKEFGKRSGRTTLKHSHLKKVIDRLCYLPLKERRNVPGINPERADIIIGGAVILETFMEELDLNEILVSERSLRDGMLVNYLSQIEGYQGRTLPIRKSSVVQLGRTYGIEERHAEKVTSLAIMLFDSAKKAEMHNLGDKERELLMYASMLHDVGDFISFTGHHAHSYYIIRHGDLLGFDDREIALMANIARYHRKRPPRLKDPELQELPEKSRRVVEILAMFLRLAEKLDRSHAQLVESVAFMNAANGKVILQIKSEKDIQMEMWGVEAEEKAFERAFEKGLEVKLGKPRRQPTLNDLADHPVGR